MFVHGWSEANSVQPRNQPRRALRLTISPAPQDSQAGGLASHDAFVQRDEAPEITAKPLRQLWQRGAR